MRGRIRIVEQGDGGRSARGHAFGPLNCDPESIYTDLGGGVMRFQKLGSGMVAILLGVLAFQHFGPGHDAPSYDVWDAAEFQDQVPVTRAVFLHDGKLAAFTVDDARWRALDEEQQQAIGRRLAEKSSARGAKGIRINGYLDEPLAMGAGASIKVMPLRRRGRVGRSPRLRNA
jgi:hypothetical protein